MEIRFTHVRDLRAFSFIFISSIKSLISIIFSLYEKRLDRIFGEGAYHLTPPYIIWCRFLPFLPLEANTYLRARLSTLRVSSSLLSFPFRRVFVNNITPCKKMYSLIILFRWKPLRALLMFLLSYCSKVCISIKKTVSLFTTCSRCYCKVSYSLSFSCKYLSFLHLFEVQNMFYSRKGVKLEVIVESLFLRCYCVLLKRKRLSLIDYVIKFISSGDQSCPCLSVA